MALAFKIGLPRAEFWAITPKLFSMYLEEYQKKELQREKGAWERCRWLARFVLMPYSKKNIQLNDLAVFPWEKEVESKLELVKQIPENFKQLAAAMDAKAKEQGIIK